MNDSLSIGSSSDQDDSGRMQYIRKDFLQPNNHGEGESDDDDSSSRFFVSEPSTSVADSADSSENLMRLGLIGGGLGGGTDDRLLRLDPSASEDDNLLLPSSEHDMPPPELFLPASKNEGIGEGATGAAPPLPPNAVRNFTSPPRPSRPRTSPPGYSPDNASLSSHDTSSSSILQKKVELDFSPVAEEEAASRTSGAKPTNPSNRADNSSQPRSLTFDRTTVEGDSRRKNKTVNLAQAQDFGEISSNSSSSASEAQVQQLGEFLDDLRINSEGQMKESSVPGSNTSFESSILVTRETEVEDVLRRNSGVGAPYGRRGATPPHQQTRVQPIPPSSSRDSSASRLFMESVNSRGTSESLAMTFSNDASDYRHQQQQPQQQDALVGDTIEMMTSSNAPPLSLPPLYATTTATSGGRKQQHDRHRRWSGENDVKSMNQDGLEAQHYHDGGNAVSDMNNRNSSLKSTIDNSGDEWNKQQKEIGLFSQFATDTIDNDGATRRSHRTRQRSYRQMRAKQLRQESGEDSSSQASSDQSYVNFFQSQPQSQQPLSQPPIDVSYQTTGSPSPLTARVLSNGQGRSSPPLGSPFNMQSPRNRAHKKTSSLSLSQPTSANPGPGLQSFGSYDGIRAAGRSVHQHSPPLYLDSSNHSAPSPLGNPMYQPSPTYYVPTQTNQHGNSETPMLNQRFSFDQHQPQVHHQYSHIRSHSAMPVYERPFDGGNHPFLHSQQHFSAAVAHSETPTKANQFFSDEINRNRMESYDSLRRTGNVEHDIQKYQMEQQRRDSYVFEDDISYSVSDRTSDDSIERERDIHLLHDGSRQDMRVIRHHHLDDTIPKFDRRQFLPQTSTNYGNAGETKYPTFVCPNCKMRQREFFTVSSAPKQYESEGTVLSLFFALYVVASLFIFGLQEGWGKLDCIYFAVITLTTAGLGDLVPTTDGAKIICSMFIYFGVACIGLLLGSYIAGMLDEKSYREAVANQIKACPNCARIKNMKYIAEQRRADFATPNAKMSMEHIAEIQATALRKKRPMERSSKNVRRADDSQQAFQSDELTTNQSMERDKEDTTTTPKVSSSFESPSIQKQLLGSPMTTQILHRQRHTRHMSVDIGTSIGNARMSLRTDFDQNTGRFRNNSADIHIPATVSEGAQTIHDTKNEDDAPIGHTLPHSVSEMPQRTVENDVSDDSITEDSDSDIDSLASEDDEIEGRNQGVKNAKFVILTLREALVNSLVIIAFGCLGFYLIEGFSFVDSLYFTTVLLTSTGYGDIVPSSDGGKLFATVYLLVGGTILLNNMSMISMIPLELRKRRTEHSVLTQFGDSLDDDALRELATGPLIQRINLGGKDPRGLDECTREMFALAMMIRLGKVTEHDINLTFAAFRKLDVNNEGILNSKSIIGGMIQNRRKINQTNKTNNERSDHNTQYTDTSQGYGTWMNPPVAYFDGTRNRSGSNSSYDPNPHAHSVNHSDQAPLLSMSERGFPQYGMNQYPFVPTLNE
jgi:hypothetical protein